MNRHLFTFVTVAALSLANAGHGAAEEAPATQPAEVDREALLDPGSEQNNRTAPDRFQARFETTAGVFVIDVHREWAPLGADRFYNLVTNGYFHDQRFFRLVPGFVVQWGMQGDPKISRKWREATIKDDPVRESNTRGRVTFANGGPDTRSTQLFINFSDRNTFLDDPKKMRGSVFAPFGEVIEGMAVVDEIEDRYGEQPDQAQINYHGNEYLDEKFPRLDRIVRTAIVDPEEAPATQPAE